MTHPGAESAIAPTPRPLWRRHLKTIVGLATLAVVLVLVTLAVLRDRDQFGRALREIGWRNAVLSALCAAGGVACGYGVWIETLAGLDARLPMRASIQAFFVSQLGKYLPGSVWPVLAQMEAGRTAGVKRRTMLAANMLTLLISLAVGSAIACALLPVGSPEALRRFWWLFIALPFLVALLHPRVLPVLIDRLFSLARQPALDQRLKLGNLFRGAAWAGLGWLLLGAHVAVLLVGLGHSGLAVLALCTGAMALAVSVGILFIPAPAGAGLREAALLLALSPILSEHEGLAVAIVSRIELIVVDLALAGLAAVLALVLRRRLSTSIVDTGADVPN